MVGYDLWGRSAGERDSKQSGGGGANVGLIATPEKIYHSANGKMMGGGERQGGGLWVVSGGMLQGGSGRENDGKRFAALNL